MRLESDHYTLMVIAAVILLWIGAQIGKGSVKDDRCPGIEICSDMMVHGTDTFRCAKPSPEAIKYFESQN
jgi:hypothetical protein